ncbi:hypothetical protein GCM10009530_71530 [Microbispora corallina]|uniref:Uncharacterized protein n=1 Tax=Microbispora corallina TaxID=83302 RepID=A0ABQ4G0Z1_9ACTN|nr:hypothetical protein [Microbispora corallina]GIH40736.1 hypothetical protein Mco01_37360 [Microbispora corallina]
MSSNQPPHAAAATAAATVGGGGTPDARQLRAILTAVSIALMAVIASVSGLNVAQTHMAVEWGASQTAVLWIINVTPLPWPPFCCRSVRSVTDWAASPC